MIDLLLCAVAFCSGAINAVAGGGTFLSFPALVLAGIPPIAANATSATALFPGVLASSWAYRDDIKRIEVNLKQMAVISIGGGFVGAMLLLWTPERTFAALVPWLLLAATLLFAGGGRLAALVRSRVQLGPAQLLLIQFLIAIYGGYFGGAIGILMLASYQIFGMTDLNAMNGLKNFLSFTLNATAVICFVIAGRVVWAPALVMLVGAVLGGYVGARVARRARPELVRVAIIVIGFTMTLVLFLRG